MRQSWSRRPHRAAYPLRTREKLAHKFQWVRDMGVTEGDVYDQTTAAAVEEFQKRVGLPATGIADFATCGRLGAWPPPPSRHAGLTFRGTGGIVGLDYTSRVAQEAGLEEFPISLPRIDGWQIRGGQVQPVRAGADNEASLNPTGPPGGYAAPAPAAWISLAANLRRNITELLVAERHPAVSAVTDSQGPRGLTQHQQHCGRWSTTRPVLSFRHLQSRVELSNGFT